MKQKKVKEEEEEEDETNNKWTTVERIIIKLRSAHVYVYMSDVSTNRKMYQTATLMSFCQRKILKEI